jgi:hypothetical protein
MNVIDFTSRRQAMLMAKCKQHAEFEIEDELEHATKAAFISTSDS